ncbi:redoxin domain-containing protein [Bacteroidota bacterium]
MNIHIKNKIYPYYTEVILKQIRFLKVKARSVSMKECQLPLISATNSLFWKSSYLWFILYLLFNFQASAQKVNINVHVRGVYESKITLLPLPGTTAFKSIKPIISAGIKNGETTTFSIAESKLPALFVLRFDYKENENSTPYPCEKQIFLYKQNIELWANPMYCINNDSSYFQKDEKENTMFAQFTEENGIRKEKLGLLQNFLMNYDDTESKFYKQGIKEYKKRRSEYNLWLTKQSTQYQALFVSHSFQFQYVPKIAFKCSEADRMQSVTEHYFDGIDFNDTLLLNTTELKKWMDSYVNIYGTMVKTEAQTDSLFTLAGKRAIEKARPGHPKVYGWMVDYFYSGYESFNMAEGIKMLEPYLNDTNCLTTKRMAIEKRLKGMETLLIGTLAPDFTLKNDIGIAVRFSDYKTNSRYKLLLFWSADCGHCKELINKLYTWHQQLNDKKLVEVFALSLDETETEIPIWQSAITQFPAWNHIRCEGGVNSKEADAYFILSTPVMILVDAKTNKIVALPETMQQLMKVL